MSLVKPIGPTKVPKPYSIKDLPPLIIGGTVFNTQYTSNPHNLPATEILETAFSNGLIAIDTSPYYGPSEEILGESLKKVRNKWKRESYYICTKAGRIRLNEFDYSRESVRKSVQRSLKRLDSSYIDLVYMHDIEFVKEDEIFEALKELRLLKDEGLIKSFGITGYPIKFLYKIALESAKTEEIGPLDAIMSYSNGCIQNTLLFDYYLDFFKNCGIKKLMNGSILSMSLLRSDKTHDFHPAPQQLKDRVNEIATILKINYNGLELADLATRFALKKWLFETTEQSPRATELTWNQDCSIVLGVSNVEELNAAISNYWMVKLNLDNINGNDLPIFEKVKQLLGSEHYNETWDSGIENRD